MKKMKEKLLITLATGKTGYTATLALLEDGYPVRILVRSRNAKALELEKRGAEIVLGEFGNPEQLRQALHGVSKVYYCYPFTKHMPVHVPLFIQAAKEANIEAVVFMGQWLAEFDDQESILTNHTREAYRQFAQSGLNLVYLNPGYFADNAFPVLEFVWQLGIFPSTYGNGKNPWISNEDLGLAIAALLKNPAPYYGQKVHPTGPKSISAKEMTAVFAKVRGKQVMRINIPEWLFVKAGIMFGKEFGFDAFTISQGRLYNKQFQLNRFDAGGVTDVVKELTGKQPDDFETIVKRYVEKASFRERNFRNWWAALKKFMTMPFTPIPSARELARLNS